MSNPLSWRYPSEWSQPPLTQYCVPQSSTPPRNDALAPIAVAFGRSTAPSSLLLWKASTPMSVIVVGQVSAVTPVAAPVFMNA